MADQKEFQKRLQKVGDLVQELDSIADPAVRASTKGLVQLLMDLHGTALERILEIVFESGDGGARVIDALGDDPLVGSLLVLYGMHPEEIDVRVARKLKQIETKLFKMGAEAKLVSVNGGDVRVRATVEGHACGSTKKNVEAAVEEAMYEAAPDLTSLVVEGLEEPNASGFVGVGQLIDSIPHASASPASHAVALNSERMD